jgi:hypothetical protein
VETVDRQVIMQCVVQICLLPKMVVETGERARDWQAIEVDESSSDVIIVDAGR